MTEKTLDTLVEDIYALFSSDFQVDEEEAKVFGHNLASIIVRRINEERKKQTLRMSNLGAPCDLKLWYDINAHELGEGLEPSTRMKFLFGDILEELMLFLAHKAGHKVEGQQEYLEYEGVPGHRDAIIDGVQTDCKSASSFAFKKFKDHKVEEDDPFGYIDQQNLYLEASKNDPRITDKEHFAFFVIDKAQGHLCVDKYKASSVDYKSKVADKRQMLNTPTPPPRGFEDVPDGKSGNRKLGIHCSYCAYKEPCWPNLRTYLYSSGPRFLTQVRREPKVDQSVTDIDPTHGF